MPVGCWHKVALTHFKVEQNRVQPVGFHQQLSVKPSLGHTGLGFRNTIASVKEPLLTDDAYLMSLHVALIDSSLCSN